MLWKAEHLETMLRQQFGFLNVALSSELRRSIMTEIQFKLAGFVRYWAKQRPGINGRKQEFGSLLLHVDCCSLV